MARTDLHSVVSYLRRLGHQGAEGGSSDAQLLNRFVQSHDEAAFEVLVWRHGSLVLGICRKYLVRHHDVEDAFQATFLALSRQAGAIVAHGSAAGWLAKVAGRVSLRLRKQVNRERAQLGECADLAQLPAPASGGNDLEKCELWRQVIRELTRLPDRLRLPIVACFLQCKTHEQAAQELRIPMGSMANRLQKGCRLLQSRLTRRGAGSLALLAGERVHAELWPALVQFTVTNAAQFTRRVAVRSRAATLARWAPANMLLGSVKVPVALLLGICAVAFLAQGMGRQANRIVDGAVNETGTQPPASIVTDKFRSKLDLYGDPLPAGALLRLGSLQGRLKTGMGRGVTFNSDGQQLITCGDDGWIRFWNVATGKEFRTIGIPAKNYRAFASSADGKSFAAADGETIRIWDTRTKREVHKLACEIDGQSSPPICFAPTGSTLAIVAKDTSIQLFDAATGKQVRSILSGGNTPHRLGFSADGKRLLSVGDWDQKQPIREWDIDSGKLLRSTVFEISPGIKRMRCMAFSPGADRVAVEGATLERVNRPDGSISVFTIYRLCLWDTATGKEVLRTDGETEPIWAAAFSSDGQFVATIGMGSEVAIWDTQRGNLRQRLKSYPYGSRPDSVNTLAFSRDGTKVAAVGNGAAIQVWNAPSGNALDSFGIGHRAELTALGYSPDGATLASASSDHSVRLWDTITGKHRHVLSGHPASVAALAYAPSGQLLASADGECRLFLWDTSTGKERWNVETVPKSAGMYSGICPIAFAADAKTIWSWSGDDQQLRSWDIATGKQLEAKATAFSGRTKVTARIENPHEDPDKWLSSAPHGAKFSLDARYLAVAFSDRIFVLETASNREICSMPLQGFSTVFGFSRDGKFLACGGWDKVVHVLDLQIGKEIKKYPQADVIHAVEFSSDGRTIAVSIGWVPGTIMLLDAGTGAILYRTPGLDSRVGPLAFAPDGTTLASGQSDSTALIWDLGRLSQAERKAKEAKKP